MVEEILSIRRTREKFPERTNNETELTSLPNPECIKVVIKISTELRKIININADNCNKELETIKMNQSKICNSTSKAESNK